jgi:hypothetical protein
MPWAKIDDRFHSHRKVRRAGLEATGLFARSLSYSAAESTEGHIEDTWVEEVAGKRAGKLAEILMATRLWERNGTGYMIHDWLAYNISVADAAKLKKKKKEAGEKSAALRAAKATGDGAQP